jgi:hypothetical protein
MDDFNGVIQSTINERIVNKYRCRLATVGIYFLSKNMFKKI